MPAIEALIADANKGDTRALARMVRQLPRDQAAGRDPQGSSIRPPADLRSLREHYLSEALYAPENGIGG